MLFKIISFLLFTLTITSFSQFKIINLDSITTSQVRKLKIKSITEIEIVYKHDRTTEAEKIEEFTEYDSKGNQIKLIRPNNWSPFLHGPLNEDSIFHVYDSLNRIVRSSHYYWNKSLFYYYHYDISGNLEYKNEFNIKKQLIDSTVFRYSGSGNLTEEITFKDKIETYRTEYTYDNFGRLIRRFWIVLDRNDTLDKVIRYYDDKNLTTQEISLNYKNDTLSTELHKYNKVGYLIFFSSASFAKNSIEKHYERKNEYLYDEEKNLVRTNRYTNNKYEGMTTYEYNKQNLLIKSIYYLEDNRPFIINRYEYEFYN